jgi:hypothetical protein
VVITRLMPPHQPVYDRVRCDGCSVVARLLASCLTVLIDYQCAWPSYRPCPSSLVQSRPGPQAVHLLHLLSVIGSSPLPYITILTQVFVCVWQLLSVSIGLLCVVYTYVSRYARCNIDLCPSAQICVYVHMHARHVCVLFASLFRLSWFSPRWMDRHERVGETSSTSRICHMLLVVPRPLLIQAPAAFLSGSA